MTIKIRKIIASPEEEKFTDLVDYCAFIAGQHGREKRNFQHKNGEIMEYGCKKFSIRRRLYDFQIPGKPNFSKSDSASAHLPYFKLSLELKENGKIALRVSGKWHHAAFDIKTGKYIRGKWENEIHAHVYECSSCNSEFPNAGPTAYQKKIENLVEKCVEFTDRHGKIVDENSCPSLANLSMRFNSPKMTVFFRTLCSPYSNGFCEVIVRENKKTVFRAKGNYGAGPYHMIASEYIPGPWEKKILKSSG